MRVFVVVLAVLAMGCVSMVTEDTKVSGWGAFTLKAEPADASKPTLTLEAEGPTPAAWRAMHCILGMIPGAEGECEWDSAEQGPEHTHPGL